MNIIDAIKAAAGQVETHVTGVVTGVDKERATISVLPDDGGEEMKSVRLRALNLDNGVGWYYLPHVGTAVLLSFIDSDRTLPFLLAAVEIDEIVLSKADGFLFRIDSDNNILVRKGNKAEISGFAKVVVECEDAELKCSKSVSVVAKTAKIKADSIELGESCSGVLTNELHPVCFVTGAPIRSSSVVKAAGGGV